MSEHTRYPLSWPEGWKRTAPSQRIREKFVKTMQTEFGSRPAGKISVADAIGRLLGELRRIGIRADDILVSTNIEVRLDGMPRSDRGEPRDPGASVYWWAKGKQQCMAIDRYDRAADNLAAIAATLEAIRAIERHGGGEILERAFQGFTALPERAGGKSWYDVLQFQPAKKPTADEVRSRFLELAKKHHPGRRRLGRRLS